MKLTLEQLNRLSVEEATRVLTECCGASRWVKEMVSRRPFGSVKELLETARKAWAANEPPDWEEAFAHHPRIGESRARAPTGAASLAWSRSEQSGVTDADETVRRALADGNLEYERKFGRIFIVAAAGKSAEELLATLRRRLDNTPAEELAIAARELGLITERRLADLITGE